MSSCIKVKLWNSSTDKAASKANFGSGMIAGVGIATIAMIADRMTQAWSRSLEKKV